MGMSDGSAQGPYYPEPSPKEKVRSFFREIASEVRHQRYQIRESLDEMRGDIRDSFNGNPDYHPRRGQYGPEWPNYPDYSSEAVRQQQQREGASRGYRYEPVPPSSPYHQPNFHAPINEYESEHASGQRSQADERTMSSRYGYRAYENERNRSGDATPGLRPQFEDYPEIVAPRQEDDGQRAVRRQIYSQNDDFAPLGDQYPSSDTTRQNNSSNRQREIVSETPEVTRQGQEIAPPTQPQRQPISKRDSSANQVQPQKQQESVKTSPKEKDTSPPSTNAKSTGDYPFATKTNRRGVVKSPFSPHEELDVEGMKSGDLAIDPSNGRIFKVP